MGDNYARQGIFKKLVEDAFMDCFVTTKVALRNDASLL